MLGLVRHNARASASTVVTEGLTVLLQTDVPRTDDWVLTARRRVPTGRKV
jgi:hypothetical protein